MTAISQIYEDVPCTFCGCLCDDIRIVVEDNVVVKCDNGCAISKTRFLGHQENRIQFPQIRSNKTLVQASLEDAINRAAEIITSARRLLVYGLSSTENDAHREHEKNIPETNAIQTDETWSSVQRRMILDALKQANGKKMEAARLLGWGRSTLWRKIKQHKIDQ